jgi:ElaB/YqjD/DUF883 family membrane-anchored ribosome-binding protein
MIAPYEPPSQPPNELNASSSGNGFANDDASLHNVDDSHTAGSHTPDRVVSPSAGDRIVEAGRQFVSNHPVTTLVLSGTAGVFLGWCVKRRRQQ